MHEKVTEIFKNNAPWRKIGRDLHVSPSAVKNVIKPLMESGGISMLKEQSSDGIKNLYFPITV